MSIRTRADDGVGLSSLDPARAPARDAAGFRRIIAARKRLAEAERELHDAVAAAYADALLPIFGWMVPLFVLTAVVALLLPEVPLSRKTGMEQVAEAGGDQ